MEWSESSWKLEDPTRECLKSVSNLPKNFFIICFNDCPSKMMKDKCNWTWTQNHLIRKRTLSHLAKLAKWLSCVLSTYQYGETRTWHERRTWHDKNITVKCTVHDKNIQLKLLPLLLKITFSWLHVKTRKNKN